MTEYMHELAKELTGMSPDNRPWDYRLFWPSLNDAPILTISIKWNEDDDWVDYRFQISLTTVSEGRTNPLKDCQRPR